MVLVAIAAVACSAPADEPCAAAEDPPACLDMRYFGNQDPSSATRCTGQFENDQLNASVQVRLFHAPGLSDADVVDQSLRMQRYYAPYGLSFRAAAAAEPTTLIYAISGAAEQIEQALGNAGIDLDQIPTDDEARRAHRIVGDVIFADLRAFVSAHTSADPRAVNLVLVERVMDPQLSEYLYGSPESGLLGFGLSSSMLSRLDRDDPERDLYAIIGLPESFTPVIIVGQADVDDHPLDNDNTIAHEAGHALGLIHSSDPDNLMYPFTRSDCEPNLSGEQLAHVSAMLR